MTSNLNSYRGSGALSPAFTSSKAQNKIKALHTGAASTLRACPSPKNQTLLQLECLIQHLSFHFVVYI